MAVAPLQPSTFVAVDVSYILCFVTDMRANAVFQYTAFINQIIHGRFVYAKVKGIAVPRVWGSAEEPCVAAGHACPVGMCAE